MRAGRMRWVVVGGLLLATSATAAPRWGAAEAIRLLRHYELWTGEEVPFPVQLVHEDDGTPAGGAEIVITAGEETYRYRTDSEGRAVVRLTEELTESRTRTESRDGRPVRPTAMFHVRTDAGRVRGPLHYVSTVGSPSIGLPNGQRLYVPVGMEADAARLVPVATEANRISIELFGTSVVRYDLLLTGLDSDDSYVTEGNRYGLNLGELHPSIDLRTYVHESIEDLLSADLDLYSDRRNRWIGDGIAEWGALYVLAATKPERAVADLEGRIAELRYVLERGRSTIDLQRDFRVATLRTLRRHHGKPDEIVDAAAGYGAALALWLTLIDGRPDRLVRFVDHLRADGRRRPRTLVRAIESLLEAEGVARRLSAYGVSEAIGILESERARIESRLVWEFAGTLSFSTDAPCVALDVVVGATPGVLLSDVDLVVELHHADGTRAVSGRLARVEPPALPTLEWFEPSVAEPLRTDDSSSVSMTVRVPVDRTRLPTDARVQGAALVRCDGRPQVLEQLTVGRDDLAVRTP